MEKLLRQLSKSTLAFLVIAGGILFIVVSDPPRSVCDSQIDQFKQAQSGILFSDRSNKVAGQVKQTELKKQSDFCKTRNSPGACFELFSHLKVLVKELDFVDSRCRKQVSGLSQVKQAIYDNLELMTRLAWGEKPPVNYYAKLNWFSGADMKLYCDLKRLAYDLYGKSQWEDFREQMMSDLPGVDTLSREQAWNVILLSTKCEAYL